MKIQNSTITMASAHQEHSYTYKESMTMEAAKSKDAVGAILVLSQESSGKSIKDAMIEYQKQEEEEAKKKQQENEARSLQEMAKRMKAENTKNPFELPDDLDVKVKMLRQILASLRGEKIPEDCKIKPGDCGGLTDLRSARFRNLEELSFRISSNAAVGLGAVSINEIGTNRTGTTWQRITASNEFVSEFESTTFASKGLVQTADGRSIDFDIEVSMSRSFMQESNLLEVEEYIKTDPLIINLDNSMGYVSDQKFYFDLDSDGKEEKISFAGQGSGFLALDKNNDGIINDGSELFGTSSGDGFKDLAMYDEDGNGWIDENDSVFHRLKVWTKDENGNDYLIDLKKADVGAIYLGNTDTEFSIKNDENQLDAQIRKTGIYLKESTGLAGTINHVDLVL